MIEKKEIEKVTNSLQESMVYFSENQPDQHTEQIIEQISGTLVILELAQDESNAMMEQERENAFELASELAANSRECINFEKGIA